MTVLKKGSTLTSGGSVGDTQAAVQCKFSSAATNGQNALALTDYLNAPIFAAAKASNGQDGVYGDKLTAFSHGVSYGCRIDGTRNPAPFQFVEGGTAYGMRVWSGSGAPGSSTVGGAASVGDLYLRTDTPTTANQRIYTCTTAGTPGTWTAVT